MHTIGHRLKALAATHGTHPALICADQTRVVRRSSPPTRAASPRRWPRSASARAPASAFSCRTIPISCAAPSAPGASAPSSCRSTRSSAAPSSPTRCATPTSACCSWSRASCAITTCACSSSSARSSPRARGRCAPTRCPACATSSASATTCRPAPSPGRTSSPAASRARRRGASPRSMPSVPTDDAAIFFTSGSTAAPKGVVHTHASMLQAADNVGDRLGLTADDRTYGYLPLFFNGGMVGVALATLSRGATRAAAGGVRRRRDAAPARAPPLHDAVRLAAPGRSAHPPSEVRSRRAAHPQGSRRQHEVGDGAVPPRPPGGRHLGDERDRADGVVARAGTTRSPTAPARTAARCPGSSCASSMPTAASRSRPTATARSSCAAPA